jgi:tRNA(Ile)-lysidine synthase
VADALELAFARALRPLVPDGSLILAAGDGGADSTALLHLLRRVAPARDYRIVVAHLDHGLRRGATAERRWVERMADTLGLPCVAERRAVRIARREGDSPEEAARRVRRGFLEDTARRCGARHIATGHTLEDQAETVLFRLARGSAPTALAAMSAAGPGPFVRPLLGIARADLRAYLRRGRIPFLEDPSNANLDVPRNRIRHEVLPALCRAVSPRAARHIAAAAARLRADAALLDDLARAAAARLATRRALVVRLDAAGMAALPAPLGGRVARLVLESAGIDPRRLSARHVQALLELAAAPGGELDLPGQRAVRRGDAVAISRVAAPGRPRAGPGRRPPPPRRAPARRAPPPRRPG